MNRCVPAAAAGLTILTMVALLAWGGAPLVPGRQADALLPPRVESGDARAEVFASDRVVRLDGDGTL